MLQEKCRTLLSIETGTLGADPLGLCLCDIQETSISPGVKADKPGAPGPHKILHVEKKNQVEWFVFFFWIVDIHR